MRPKEGCGSLYILWLALNREPCSLAASIVSAVVKSVVKVILGACS